MRDPRDESNSHFCKECGSTTYDKEWGLSHHSGCNFAIENKAISTSLEKENSFALGSKPTISSEMANDFSHYHIKSHG